MNLGKLEKVNLREYWKHEALDFTNWLAKEENLNLLSEEVGIDIILKETEASVGKFSVDILAIEDNSDRLIVIENQLERTDHDHLGKIVTYASGYDAEIIIWIVKEVRDEHKKAIDWLNENTTDKINFFLIEMELWKIGDSHAAPKFQIISKPNSWAKAMKSSSTQQSTTSDLKLLQLNFWTNFIEHLKDANSTLSTAKVPKPQHWYDISFGTSRGWLSCGINSQKKFIQTGIYIPNDNELYQELFEHKDDIENELGFQLDWRALENRKASRIIVEKHNIDFMNKDNWNSYFDWFRNKTETIQKVFQEYV